jgi:hypothetical protein
MPVTKKKTKRKGPSANRLLEIELAKLASDRVRQILFKIAATQKVTPESIFKTIGKGMASEVFKATYDTQAGKWVYSKKYVDYNVRLKASAQAAENLGMKAAQRVQLSGPNGGPIPLSIIDFNTIPEKDKKRLKDDAKSYLKRLRKQSNSGR